MKKKVIKNFVNIKIAIINTFFAVFLLASFCVPLSAQIVINEIMYNPSGNEPEWIELYNSSNITYSDSLRISDPVRLYSFYISDFRPKTYCILTHDTISLAQFRTLTDSAKYVQTKIPGLNNDKDTLSLLDISSKVIDKFIYKGTWSTKGFSLERLSPIFSADNNETLKQSIASDSASCGRLNSISANIPIELPDNDGIEITPNPFSPNSSNGKNICKFIISFAEEYIDLKITCYDMTGNKLLELANHPEKFAPGIYNFSWNGYNEKGYPVQPGIYPVIIEYRKDNSTEMIIHKKLVVVGT